MSDKSGYTYEEWREISNAIGDAMQYAHDKALETPHADPLWNMDEYVNRVLDVIAGARVCGLELSTNMSHIRCNQCGYELPYGTDLRRTKFCGGCGRRVVE